MEYKAIQFKDADVNMDKRIIRGYASTYDMDQGGDIIHQGAFTKTLKERMGRIKVLRNHKELIGKPVSAMEDGHGLVTESYIAKTALGDETLMLAREGVLDSMSIGYVVPQGKSNYEGDVRNITEVKLFEWSMVDFPMNEAATITDVKQLHDKICSGTLEPQELKQLTELLADLNALLVKQKPSNDTFANDGQPHDLKSLIGDIKNWGK